MGLFSRNKDKDEKIAEIEIIEDDLESLEDRIWPVDVKDCDRCRTSFIHNEEDSDELLGVSWLEAVRMPDSKNWLIIKITQYANNTHTAHYDEKTPTQKTEYFANKVFSFRKMMEELSTFEHNPYPQYQVLKNTEMDKILKKYNKNSSIEFFMDTGKRAGIMFETDGTPRPTLRGCFAGAGHFPAETTSEVRQTEQNRGPEEPADEEATEKPQKCRLQDMIRTEAFGGVDFYNIQLNRPKIDKILRQLQWGLNGLTTCYKEKQDDRFGQINRLYDLSGRYEHITNRYVVDVGKYFQLALNEIEDLSNVGDLEKGLKTLWRQLVFFAEITMLRDALDSGEIHAQDHLESEVSGTSSALRSCGMTKEDIRAWRIYLMREDITKLFDGMQKILKAKTKEIKILCDPFQAENEQNSDMKALMDISAKTIKALPSPKPAPTP